jgi:hypothetical protein
MVLAQPAFDPHKVSAPLGAVVARQFSVWPFAARTARLFLLVDPLPDAALRLGLLRAMQAAYFDSHCCSQTRAVREAALAAHYVLQHHNRDVLAQDQVNAAAAVAALRGNLAFVALAGDAAAYASHDGIVGCRQASFRQTQPLGLDPDPPITLWSTPLLADDRLLLVCGANRRTDASRLIQDALTAPSSTAEAEQHLGEALGDERPAGVLIVSPGARREHIRAQTHVLAQARPRVATQPSPGRVQNTRRWLVPLIGLVVLAGVVLAGFVTTPLSVSEQPTTMAMATLGSGDRVDRVSPAMVVRLGPSATNVVDLAVGDTALYTLDVGEGSIRAFSLEALDQQPGPETLLATAGTPVDAAGHRLSTPVAMEYLGGASAGPGVLAVIDQARSVVQVDGNRRLSMRSLPNTDGWQELGALGSGPAGELLFLDSGAHALLDYPTASQRVTVPPRLLADAMSAPELPFERVAEMIGEAGALVVRLDTGTVNLVSEGVVRPLPVVVDGGLGPVTGIASDRAGGLYLADPANARVVQAALDGSVVRELRDAALAGVRQIQSSPDGRRLYGLVASGVLVFDVPTL